MTFGLIAGRHAAGAAPMAAVEGAEAVALRMRRAAERLVSA